MSDIEAKCPRKVDSSYINHLNEQEKFVLLIVLIVFIRNCDLVFIGFSFLSATVTCEALQMFAIDPSHWPSVVRRDFLLTVRNLFKDASES